MTHSLRPASSGSLATHAAVDEAACFSRAGDVLDCAVTPRACAACKIRTLVQCTEIQLETRGGAVVMYVLRFAMEGLASILRRTCPVKRLNCAATCRQRRSDSSKPTRAAVVVLSQEDRLKVPFR